MKGFYSREWFRQEQEERAERVAPKLPFGPAVPPDARVEDEECVLHAWDGEKFVPYKLWLARLPLSACVQTPLEKSLEIQTQNLPEADDGRADDGDRQGTLDLDGC